MTGIIHITLFASGTGSNVRNIIRYFENHRQIRVALLVSNNPASGAVQKAEAAGIEVLVPQKHELMDGEWLVAQLKARNIHFIVLAGYLKMIPPALTAAYSGKIINIHPALLPKFGGKGMYGRYVHEAVKAAGEAETGITVHFVNEVYDEGEIIVQKKVRLEAHDTPETIEAKVRSLEAQWFPAIIESVILQKTLP